MPFLHLQLWDVRRKGCIFTYKGHTESINSIQFSPDGKWIVSASSDSTIKVLVEYSGIHITVYVHVTCAVVVLKYSSAAIIVYVQNLCNCVCACKV